jgi:hypothetical protein
MYSNLRVQSIGGFSNYWYWTSSQDDPINAWFMHFGGGNVFNDLKLGNYQVRAVRAF